MLRTIAGIFAASLLMFGSGRLHAQTDASARQKYGPWQFNKEKNYYYREYLFKVKASDPNYEHQYCIYFKNDARINNNWVYFYNPKTETYWARYPTVNNETYRVQAQKREEMWSVLPASGRNRNIYAIDPKAWPTPSSITCPPIPGAIDNVLLISPPADLP